jgi:hypothetical protein
VVELEKEKDLAESKFNQLQSENRRFKDEIDQFKRKMGVLSNENQEFETIVEQISE